MLGTPVQQGICRNYHANVKSNNLTQLLAESCTLPLGRDIVASITTLGASRVDESHAVAAPSELMNSN